MAARTRPVIDTLFSELDTELRGRLVIGELYLVGGAVMCLVFDARASTADVDALFRPAREVRDAAARVGDAHGLGASWLNDAVKGYLSDAGQFTIYLDQPNLRVFVATAEYLLAMKAMAMRLGAEFHDESDVRYLLRFLNVTNVEEALEIVGRFYARDLIPPKTVYALAEMLGGQAESE